MKCDFYKREREASLARLAAMKKRAGRIVLLRSLAFIAAVFAFAASRDGHAAGTILGILLLALFVLLVRRHQRARRAQAREAARLAVIADCLARFAPARTMQEPGAKEAAAAAMADETKPLDWKRFLDDGTAYRKKARPQDTDLHLFGAASLYQFLSCARTKAGRERLAAALSPVPPAKETIRARQNGAREFIDAPALALGLLTLARLLPDGHDTAPIVRALASDAESPCGKPAAQDTSHIRSDDAARNKTPPAGTAGAMLSFGRILLPILSFSALVLAAIGPIDIVVPGLLFALQLTLALAFLHQNSALFAPLRGASRALARYEALFAAIESASFAGSTMRAMQAALKKDGAAHSLRRLATIAACTGQRANLFFFLIANTLFLWDFQCAARFLRWRTKHGTRLAAWLGAWAETEVLLSLATIGQTREASTFPVLLDGAPRLMAKGVTTPLIAESAAVPNDADFSAGTAIITGSNMSGKTTYLRTLAASAVLAYAGAPVCAASFALTPMTVLTSIQANDDLSRGISTFYAELLRIKQMVEATQEGTPLLLAIDEIFKGTNSADRITGAKATIRRLTQETNITLVTTHDFELCDLTSGSGLPIQNYHFEEHYEADQIRFDFKLKEGRCHTTNAKYLLKMAGIL